MALKVKSKSVSSILILTSVMFLARWLSPEVPPLAEELPAPGGDGPGNDTCVPVGHL